MLNLQPRPEYGKRRRRTLSAITPAAPLFEIIGHHVALQPRSRGLHVGLSPFHAEETPSFVNDAKGKFHCLSCGAHGDAADPPEGVIVALLAGVGMGL